jgi:type IV pilus assembly protein PilW
MKQLHHRPLDRPRGQRGFTLIELLVTVVVSGVVMAGIYTTFASQQNSYIVQSEVAALQQNLRAAMYNLKREVRMAGYDPAGTADAGILSAGSDTIQVSMDLTDDAGTGDPDGDVGDLDETVTYTLSDWDGDGLNDLVRRTGGTPVMAAEHIDGLNFVYLDGNGAVTGVPDNIRSVQITVVARTGKPIRGYTNSGTYTNQRGDTVYEAPGDSYRRDVLTAQVKCRNLGLE